MYIRFLLLIILLHSYSVNAQERQIVTAGKLNELLKLTEKDSVLYLERLTAIHFHKIFNEYRVSKKLNTVGWDDTLWLASRNHNIWLEQHHEMTHTEKEKTKFYTGKSPSERLNFAAEKKISFSWLGENCLQNNPLYGNYSMEEQAQQIAKIALDQWIDSEGHRQNMLSKNMKKHGIAFSFGQLVYATDALSGGETAQRHPAQLPLFKADNTPVFAENEKVINFASLQSEKVEDNLVATPTKSNLKTKKVSTSSVKKEMAQSFYYLKIKESLAGNAKSDVHYKKLSEKMAVEFLHTSLKNKQLMKESLGKEIWLKSFTQEIDNNFIGQFFNKPK